MREWSPRRCNCAVYALYQFVFYRRRLRVVWSRDHVYTHWYYWHDGAWHSYSPLRKPSFVLWFRGRVGRERPPQRWWVRF